MQAADALGDRVGELVYTDGPGDPRVALAQKRYQQALEQLVSDIMEFANER